MASLFPPGSTRKPAVAESPRDIQYLAFQWSGGKGVAYLGALDWLERNGAPLPISPKQIQALKVGSTDGTPVGSSWEVSLPTTLIWAGSDPTTLPTNLNATIQAPTP